MKNTQINQNLISHLEGLIDKRLISSFIQKYKNQLKIQHQLEDSLSQQNTRNEADKKVKRLGSKSKQRLLLRKKQSKKKFEPQEDADNLQGPVSRICSSQQAGPKKLIKDKAVYVNVNEIPYLHSTDLLNHLYKKSSNLGQQDKIQTPLYNPPLNNPYALTKVKHLHIYYCKIESLRDIGTGWSNLIQLSVYYGRLKDLSGLNAFPSLQYLHCPFNSISTLSDLMFHPTLLSIDLELNKISDISEVQHLFTVDNLEYINLLGNPVYSSKESKRKINQKFQKIIETQNCRLQQYLSEKDRSIWELQNIHGIEYCNNLLNQFFVQSKQDEITVESKYTFCYKGEQHNNQLDFEANFNQQNLNKQSQSSQMDLKIQYIAPEIPQNAFFEQMIINGTSQQEQNQGNFCQEKIYLTPLIEMINKNETFIGPVLNKYLNNKLYARDQVPRQKAKVKLAKDQQEFNEDKVKTQKSKFKKISKMSLTGFSNKESSDTRYASTLISGNEQHSHQIPSQREFEKTSTSFSTNCTNMNNTSTNFTFRRTRPTLSKSKQKSLTKTSLISKISQNMATTQNISINNHQLHSSSLIKQSRMLLGRSSKKETQIQSNQEPGVQKSIQRQFERHLNNNVQLSLQKGSYSITLKRKTMLSSSKKQKSSILKRELQL